MAVSGLKNRIEKNLAPSLIIRLSEVDAPMRLAARAKRARGQRGSVELFFAFDDASSAYALITLAELVNWRDVDLIARPVVNRGIPDDPAVDRKRSYAIDDAVRLFARGGTELVRRTPIDPEATAWLAQWVADAPQSAALTDFTVEAVRLLWLTDGQQPDRERFERLWSEKLGGSPPAAGDGLASNEQRMARLRMYETPAAWVTGRWFFAHERVAQIGEWLDRLGWEER